MNIKTGRILKNITDGCGHFIINLRKDNKTTKLLVHRLVALTFLENFEKKI
jgi:hypothetical protein